MNKKKLNVEFEIRTKVQVITELGESVDKFIVKKKLYLEFESSNVGLLNFLIKKIRDKIG